jgi:hypothetical protein
MMHHALCSGALQGLLECCDGGLEIGSTATHRRRRRTTMGNGARDGASIDEGTDAAQALFDFEDRTVLGLDIVMVIEGLDGDGDGDGDGAKKCWTAPVTSATSVSSMAGLFVGHAALHGRLDGTGLVLNR